MFYRIMKFLAWPLAHILFWPVIKGGDKIPDKGPLVLAGNHLGTGESFLLPILVHPELTFPVKEEFFKTDTVLHRMGGWFLRAIHQVPMDRSGGEATDEALGSIMQILKSGGVVAIHPEGHRSPDGRLYKGHTGVARLALGAGAPIIPIGAKRTRFTKKKWLPFPWLYRPEITVGEQFQFPEEMRQAYLNAKDREESGRILREATDEVMRRIQEITGQEIVYEYSYRPKKTPKTPTGRKPAKPDKQTNTDEVGDNS